MKLSKNGLKTPSDAEKNKKGLHINVHSMQFRFFLGIAAAALVFVVVLSLINILFFDTYNRWQKGKNLANIYKEINQEYTGDIDTMESSLEEIENSSNVRINIKTPDRQTTLYDTIRAKEQNVDLFASSLSPFSTFTEDTPKIKFSGDEVDKKGYDIKMLKGQQTGQTYLALIGQLSTGDWLVLRIPYSTMQQDQMFNFAFLMISAVFSLIVCLMLGFVMAGRFARPLKEMTEIADSVARLDFSKKYKGTETADEIRQLGESINQMSDYLDESITEMKDMNLRLEKEIKQKQKIDDMRKEFIINISHELKTPIALIQGYAEGLRVGINESEEDKDYYCEIIMDEAKRMNHMVLQLLNLSKIELGNTLPMYTDVEWYELAESVVSKTKVMWQEKNIQIDMSGIGDDTVRGDWSMLEQAVTNYVTNAIDHTPNGGRITLSSSSDSQHYIFKVRNQGPNLDPEEMDKIWDKFYKLDKARTRVSGGGSGIGLSIVRAMVNAHHGGCGVTNTEDGVEFYISLPKHPVEVEEE